MIEAIRQLICGRLCVREPDPHPFTLLRHRTGEHIKSLLQFQYPCAHIRIRDREYSTLNLREFNKWIREDCVSEREYHADWHDCDDFADAIRCKIFPIAHSLKTTLVVLYSEGYNPGDYHAFNLLIDDTDAIYVIEPQEDHVVPAAESVYLPDFIML